jgi:hypothetical protein
MWSTYVAAALLGAVSASPLARPESISNHVHATANTPARRQSSQEPCAQIAAQQARGSSSSGFIELDADTALACMQSVPFESRGAATQILGLQTMVDFQSTLAYLKDPPNG